MSEVGAALLLGIVTGFGVAIPLGPIGVLLIRTGVSDGWRTATAAAFGIAAVDLGYAALATVAGSAVAAALDGHEQQVRWVSAAVLAGLAVWGLVRTVRGRTSPTPVGSSTQKAHSGAVWLRFVALTALNPMTVLYFAVVVTGFASGWSGAGPRAAFLLGVGVASATWQLFLAALGAGMGLRAGNRTRVALTLTGDLLLLSLSLALAL